MSKLSAFAFIVLVIVVAGAYVALALALAWPSSVLVVLALPGLLGSLFYSRRTAYGALCISLVYVALGVWQLTRDLFASSINILILVWLVVGLIELINFLRRTQQTQQENIEALLGSSPEALVLTSANYRVLRVNPRAAQVLGQPVASLVGQSLTQVLGQAVPSGRLTFVFHRPDGAQRDIETIAVPYSVAQGVAQLLVSLRDVTEARQQERERGTHSLVVQNTDNMVIITDAQGRVEWVNASFERTTGYTLAEVRGHYPGQVLQGPQTDRATVERVRLALQRQQPVVAEMLNYRKDGRPYWLEMRINPVMDDHGNLTNYVAIETDITERKRLEYRLAAQYEANRALADATTLESALPRFLAALGQHLGWERVEFWDVAEDTSNLRCVAAWRNDPSPAPAASGPLQFEVGLELAEHAWRTGHSVWVEQANQNPDFALMASAGWPTGGAALTFSQNQAQGVLVGASRTNLLWNDTVLDVMGALGAQLMHHIERHKAAAALRASQRLVERITQTLPEIIMVFDLAARRPLFVGGAVMAILGFSPHLLFLDFTELIRTLAHPDDEASLQTLFARLPHLAESDTAELEFRARHADGSWRWLYARTTLFTQDSQGTPTQILSLYSDITVQRTLRDERTRQIELLRGLNQFEHNLLAEVDEERALAPALALLGVMLGVEGVYVLQITDPGVKFATRHSWNTHGHPAPATPLEASAHAMGVWQANQPVFRTYATLNAASQPEVWAIAEWPLLINEVCWGVLRLEVCRYEPHWNETERLVLTTAASALSTALARFRSERALQNERDFAMQVLNTMGQGLVVINQQSQITYANPAIANMLGYDTDELLGKMSYHFVDAEDIHIFSRQRTLRRLGEASRYELRLRHRNGEIRHVLVHSQPINPSASYAGAIMVVTDLTENKQMEAAINASQAQLLQAIEQANQLALSAEAANRAKSDFIANISHDIRTPMNAVLGMLENLRDEPLTTHQQALTRVAHDAAHSLLTIINDLLDFSKLEAGKFVLEPQPFNVHDLLAELHHLLEAVARSKGLTMTVTVHPNTPTWLLGDAPRVRQILLNLLGNALKFTEHGGVTLTVEPERFASQPATLHFAVRDTGPGMPPDKLGSLFQPFVHANFSTTHRLGGTELGLVISHNLVSLMGGQMGVDSQPGHGATFWFTVPFAPAQPPPTSRALPAPVVSVDLTDLMVLLAEDNQADQQVVGLHLSKLGSNFEVAHNGAEALAAVQAAPEHFRVVLMSCQMPTMTGFEATRRLRAWEASTGRPRLPIIALTANASEAEQQQSQDAGMDDYLTKPVSRAALGATLSRWARPTTTGTTA